MRRILFILLLFLCSVHAGRGAVVLSVDINDATDPSNDTAPGFTAYTLSNDTLAIPPFAIDVNPAGGAVLDDVHRLIPANNASLTLAPLFRDCVYASGDTTVNYYRVGLDSLITGLIPGKKYTITAWSFDSGAAGVRTSDWSVVGLGGPHFAVNNYSFDATVPPANDTANRIVTTAIADTNGRLTLRGRPSVATATPQVFLNGLTVDEQAGAAVQASPVLALDFGERGGAGSADVQTGFTEYLLTGTPATAVQSTPSVRTFGAYTVTLTPVGGSVDDRVRTTPTNSGTFTDGLLLKDFVFASAGATGMDVKIAGLAANHSYLVELWSFDSTSPGARVSDWTVNGAFFWDDYTFNGSNLPVLNDDYKVASSFVTNATGELLISGRVVSGSPAVFLNALRVSDLVPVAIVDFGHPIISEFLASNSAGIVDEDGASSDWIEIWNTTADVLDLTGWRLTDDATLPGKWMFPSGVTVPSQARLIVWASGKNRVANPAALHTNFTLGKAAGGYLAFSKPDGTIVTSFTNIPAQFSDVSYGLAGTTEPLTEGYLLPPSPGGANGTPVPGFVADTNFDLKRGFFSTAFQLHITCATPNAQIYYTTDGSDPTTSSTAYTAAGIPIAGTTVVRAKAFAPPLSPSNIDTQTFIFRAQVQNQSANPPGWPATWGTNSEVATNNGGNGTVPSDYAMDARVVNGAIAGYTVQDALQALPSLSLVMTPSDFDSAGNGIYTNPQSVGDAWERATSLELLELDGSTLHTECGIRIHGNSSRRPFRMQKHSFRLAFRSDYGDSKLGYKLFDDTTLKSFDRLVLHAFFTDGWGMVSWDPTRYRPDNSVYFRDPWMKKSFFEMGHAQVSGRYLHLYINGLYWGVYELAERVDATWCADHYGGVPEDYDLMGDFLQVESGTSTAWDSLFSFVNSADLTVPANYSSVAAQVDLVDFVDYYLLHVHADAEDWPHHNGYAFRNHTTGTKWRFVTWDQEITTDPAVNVDRLSTNATNTTTDKTAGRLYQRLKVNPEFKLLFADRAHKQLDDTGALSLAAEQTRWQSYVDILDKAIVAESARWGDVADATPYGTAVPAGKVFTREADWLPSVAQIKSSHFVNLHNPANSISTVAKLRAQGLYPTTDAPGFGKFGGNVPANFVLSITASVGSIYYTTNGADPREALTGNAIGTLYVGPVTLMQTGTVKARVRNGTEWSALTEAEFIVGTAASAINLAVTEVNYAPVIPDQEFLELMNFSAAPIDLTGVHFEGITYTFASGTLLNAGERIVVVRDPAVFVAQYGNGPRVAGQYTGALDNTGEEIAVIAADGSDIVRFTYNNKSPWPTAAAGAGRSLVLRLPGADPKDPANWRSSAADLGNPGSSDSVAFTGNATADGDKDGLPALLEYALGTSDSVADLRALPIPGIETFTPGGIANSYLTLTSRSKPGADAATMVAELSTNLGTWDSSAAAVTYAGETMAADGSMTRKWRSTQPVGSGGLQQYFRLRVTMP